MANGKPWPCLSGFNFGQAFVHHLGLRGILHIDSPDLGLSKSRCMWSAWCAEALSLCRRFTTSTEVSWTARSGSDRANLRARYQSLGTHTRQQCEWSAVTTWSVRQKQSLYVVSDHQGCRKRPQKFLRLEIWTAAYPTVQHPSAEVHSSGSTLAHPCRQP